jgi:hypothetical protein
MTDQEMPEEHEIDIHDLVMHCVVCKKPMPDTRRRNAITCSPACTLARRRYWFSKLDAKMCRYCYKPSTPEQRAEFRQWKRRPQDAEEEELFRLWREDQRKTTTVDTRRANKRAKLDEGDANDSSNVEL